MKVVTIFFIGVFFSVHAQNNKALKPREFYNAKYEPETGIYHGAGQDKKGFKDYVNAVGQDKTPIIYMTYINLTASVEKIKSWGKDLKHVLDSLPKGIMPQIGLGLTGGNDTGAGLDKDVADGKYNAQLRAFYKVLLDLDRPSFTRIGYEFEGDWNGYSPESYKKVFIIISKAFKEKNIKSATVWCSGGGSANFMSIEKLMAYYPGDDYVDWWGIDVFSPEEFYDIGLQNFFDAAHTHKKPVMIGESTPRYVGVLDGEISWEHWFKPYFEMLYDNPGIKAFCYINWDWEYWSDKIGFQWHDWKDARIEKNPFVLEAYKTEMDKPIFIHTQTHK
ncbi:glycosyl hydrolase [Mariniflexile sp.]|uniref:glycosyl hydrolase n=1 Tax=Mariniflexile sp. TaxID=1979402 RepID=UPI0040474EC5